MKEVYTYLNKELKIKEKENIVLALSGGPDSMALFHQLLQFKKKKNINIICAHMNHNVRKESEEEREFVEKICKEKKVIFEYKKIEKYTKDKFKEEEARQKRYEFLEQIIKKYHAKYLFMAHHGDDLMETMLMRIVRGSTIKGYSGFSKIAERKDYQIIRPFINMTKQQILTYNKEKNIPYVLDPSNEKDIYVRNRYRKYILPILKKENKNVHQKFYKMSETLKEYNTFVENYTKTRIKKIYKENSLDISLFLKEEKLIQKQILHFLLEKIYKENITKITEKHVNLIFQIINAKDPNKIGNLPMQIKIRKTYNKLLIEKETEKIKPYKIELKEKTELPNGHTIEKIKQSKETSNFIFYLNSKEITLPLFVRTRKIGDTLSVKGMSGTKKIKDIFIDEKIERKKRETWPIVQDAKGTILWVPGLKKTKLDNSKEGMYDIILKYY